MRKLDNFRKSPGSTAYSTTSSPVSAHPSERQGHAPQLPEREPIYVREHEGRARRMLGGEQSLIGHDLDPRGLLGVDYGLVGVAVRGGVDEHDHAGAFRRS